MRISEVVLRKFCDTKNRSKYNSYLLSFFMEGGMYSCVPTVI